MAGMERRGQAFPRHTVGQESRCCWSDACEKGEPAMKGVLALAVLLAVAVPAFAADHAADEAAILKMWQQFSDAWGRDSHARAALWSEDASLINPFGVKANGRAAIEKVFADEDAGFAKGTTHTFSDFSFRFLTPSLVEVDATGEIKGMKGADGAELPPFHIHI